MTNILQRYYKKITKKYKVEKTREKQRKKRENDRYTYKFGINKN